MFHGSTQQYILLKTPFNENFNIRFADFSCILSGNDLLRKEGNGNQNGFTVKQ